jgi:hypothetical protein
MRFVSAPLTVAAFFGLQTAAHATVHIRVDLSSQRMHVASHAGNFDWAVSTGRPGHRTPTGVYRPQRMYTMTYSRKYEMAPMPHAIFFTGGYAIHGTYATAALGGVASHGCIRLAPDNAAALYEMVKHEGASIVIDGKAPGRDDDAATRETHRAGQRLAAHWRRHYREEALAYAPRQRARSLSSWVDDPLESQ